MNSKRFISISYLTLLLSLFLYACGTGGGAGTNFSVNDVGSVEGAITDSSSAAALSGVTVQIGDKTATTGANGVYSITDLAVGSRTITSTKTGYQSINGTVTVTKGTTVSHNIQMTANGTTPDTTPPTVSSSSPANGATGIAVSSAISVTFSEAMDCSTITTSSFTLKDSSNNAVAGSITTCNGAAATFTPSANLGSNKTYTATITTGVMDAAGNAMTNSYSWSFTTNATTSGTTAMVSGTILRHGSTIPVIGATVSVGNISATTNSNGQFQLSLPPGTYQIAASHPNYTNFYGTITITSYDAVTYDTVYLKFIPWETIGIPIAIAGHSGWEYATGLNNSIYFATPNNSGFQQHFIAYDLSSNTYSEKSLTGNNLCACGYMSQLTAGVNNKLYYFANDGAVYDPQTDKWATASYPNNRGEAGVGVLGDDIYYIGGRGPLNTCQAYNTATNSWRTIANYLYSTDWAAVTAYNNKIYVLGGASTTNKMSVYDPATNNWTALPDIPFTNLNQRPRALTYDNKIYFFSGTDIYVYDLTTVSWNASILSVPLSLGYGVIPVLANNSMYIIGYSSSSSQYIIAKYTP